MDQEILSIASRFLIPDLCRLVIDYVRPKTVSFQIARDAVPFIDDQRGVLECLHRSRGMLSVDEFSLDVWPRNEKEIHAPSRHREMGNGWQGGLYWCVRHLVHEQMTTYLACTRDGEFFLELTNHQSPLIRLRTKEDRSYPVASYRDGITRDSLCFAMDHVQDVIWIAMLDSARSIHIGCMYALQPSSGIHWIAHFTTRVPDQPRETYDMALSIQHRRVALFYSSNMTISLFRF